MTLFGARSPCNLRPGPRPAARSAKRKTDLSRRSLMLFLAAAASAPAVLVLKTARAQGDIWREYRRDDLGFRIEMPGEPKVEVKEDDIKDIWIRSVDVQVEHEQMLLGVHYTEYKNVVSAEEQFSVLREGLRLGTIPATREIPLVVNGFPAREFIGDSEGLNFIHRLVVVDNLTIAVDAHGDRSIHSSPTVRRLLDSFKLLRDRR